MSSRPIKTELSDNPKVRRSQRGETDNPVGKRILSALGPKDRKILAVEAGMSVSTLGDAIRRGVSMTDSAVRIADALGCSVDWLLTGRTASSEVALVPVEDAAWTYLPRYDLRQLTESSKGAIEERVPIRRDWLNRRLLVSTGLWLTELPSDYEALDLAEGDAVICSDIVAGAGPEEKWVCIFRGVGGPFVGRYSNRRIDNSAEDDVIVSAADLQAGDTFPIARVHARMLAKL